MPLKFQIYTLPGSCRIACSRNTQTAIKRPSKNPSLVSNQRLLLLPLAQRTMHGVGAQNCSLGPVSIADLTLDFTLEKLISTRQQTRTYGTFSCVQFPPKPCQVNCNLLMNHKKPTFPDKVPHTIGFSLWSQMRKCHTRP